MKKYVAMIPRVAHSEIVAKNKHKTMKHELTASKFIGMINGQRIYRERRGVNHIQHPVRPNDAQFTGTIRELEAASHSKLVRMN